jgi:periplasmic protein CpxP/Spy
MKKLLLICLFVAGVSAVSLAQGFPPQQTPVERAAALKTSLSLTDEQTAKITTIYTARQKSVDSLMTALNASGDFQSIMTKMQPLSVAGNAKIKALLTPDQAAAFQKQIDAQTERTKQMMQGMGGGAPPMR